MKKRILFLVFSVCVLVIDSMAELVRIEPIAAYATDSYSGRLPIAAVNGAGLSGEGLHDTATGNMWLGNGGKGAGKWFVVDLGEEYLVGQIKIWNYNQEGYSNRGLKEVDMWVSVEEEVLVDGAPVFEEGGVWERVLEGHTIAKASGAAGSAVDDVLNFDDGLRARWVGLRAYSDWGGGYGGLSEMVFYETPNFMVLMGGVEVLSEGGVLLLGDLHSLDGSDAVVGVVYGTEDGGEDLSGWDCVVWGEEVSSGEVTMELTGLEANSGYVGAFVVVDGDDVRISQRATWMTGEITVEVPNAFLEKDVGQKAVVFRRAAECAGVAIDFTYELEGDAAEEYGTELTGVGRFEVGETEVRVAFSAVDNTDSTGERSVTVRVLPGAYRVGSLSEGTFVVLDDETLTAGSYVWTGLGDGVSWADAPNWSPEGVPMYLDTVRIEGMSGTDEGVVSEGGNAAGRLFVGEASGSVGALRIGARSGFAVQSETVIGGQGVGRMSVGEGSSVVFYNHVVNVGKLAGGEGLLEMDGAMTIQGAKNLYVGNVGKGELVIGPEGTVEVTVSGQSGHTYVGEAATGEGVLRVNGGRILVGYMGVIGNHGVGYVYMDGGVVTSPSKYGLRLGGSADGSGYVEIRGGGVYSCVSGSYNQIGYRGTGVVHCIEGTIEGRGVSIGDQEGSRGTLILEEGGKVNTGTTNYNLFVGNNGDGELRMRGGTATYSKNGVFVVRNSAAIRGVVSGWGTVKTYSSGSVRNNGVVCADGEGEDRMLSISSTVSTYQNTVENEGTNGWYAVRGGCLRLVNSAVLNEGDSGVYTWGEAQEDAQLDLINSVRLGFTNVTAKVGTITGELLALDRGDLPSLETIGAGRTMIGLWRFTTNGAYDTVDMEVCYDKVAAQGGQVSLYRYNASTSTWENLNAQESAQGCVLACGMERRGSEGVGLVLAVSSPKPTVLMVR